KHHAENIVDFIFKMSIDRASTEKIGQEVGKEVFISKESIDLLGTIGATYQEVVLDRLIAALSYSDIYIQREILDALGDIGETKTNLKVILEKIQPLFNSERYELRQAAFSAVSEMILEGNSEDKEFVQMVLSAMYDVLLDSKNPEVIDSCLEALVKMSARIADDIAFDQIVLFLRYSPTPEKGNQIDQDTLNYIVQNTIIILSYMVYYNVEKITGILVELREFLKDPRSFIRYAAVDALGNYILKCPDDKKEDILINLMVISLHDKDPDVSEMCTESVAEFLVMHKGYHITIDGQKISILDYYTNGLISSKRQVAEHASEALKSISPLYEEDIYPLLAKHIREATNLELVRDCLHVIAVSGEEEHLSTELELIYELAEHEDASVRAEAIFTLGNLAQHRPEIDTKV
ncbi:MAG: HEAT repeat domain-containing protein, partial [Candidatus Heimdallarchaeota archaeon]|nr:HEAT repeat domain-containing protein [Candidatus Heimdallarchaeota archaeon]